MTELVRTRRFPRGFPRRVLAGGSAAVLMLSVTGCGAEEDPSAAARSGPTGSSSTTAGAGVGDDSAAGSGDEFCDAVAGIEDDLAALDLTDEWENDPQGFATRVSVAAERFATVEPPAPVAQPWQGLSEFLSMADAALDGVDTTDADAVAQALRFDGEEAFGMLLRLPGQRDAVGAFVQQRCGVDLGIDPPAVVSVCATLDAAHLGSVFGDAVPDGEDRHWGQGVVECMWDDGQGTEVGVVVGPGDMLGPDVLQGHEPIDVAQAGSGPVEIYDGAIGPLRSASGRTAATELDGTMVLASVRTGDVDADASKAIALVGLMVAELE